MLFKLVDNKEPVQCFIRMAGDAPPLTVGESYGLALGDSVSNGHLLGMSFGENCIYGVFPVEPWDQWFTQSMVSGELIVSSTHGLIVENRL